MLLRKLYAAVVLVFMILTVILPDAYGQAQQKYTVIEELDVKVPMRDGICLSTNIYRPKEPGKYPVLLRRTPYGNGGAGNGEARYWVERGYAFVNQDTRGRFESEGEFYPMVNEAEDGVDTIEWVMKQPWCDGKIGMHGGSYVGMTQWMPALRGEPHLVSMFPVVPFTENYTVSFQNGAFRMRFYTTWYGMMTAPYSANAEDLLNKTADAANRSLPLIEQDTKIGWRMPFYRDNLYHPEDDGYWTSMRYEGNYKNIRAAMYTVVGWFDLFTVQNLKNFVEMTKPSIDPQVRAKQHIVIGPWGHSTIGRTQLGALDFGKDAALNTQELMTRWFDATLKGTDDGILKEPPVRIFVMGDNVWRYENEWPLKRTVFTKYYLHSAGGASTKNGDGALTTEAPKNEPADRYVYDPVSPVPSMPDSSVFDDFKNYPLDYSRLEGRPDILVYSTPPLDRDTEVTGPIEIVLYAASSAANTDFTGRLLDVYPDGRAIALRDGIIRASFRSGPRNTSNIHPGEVYQYHIDLGPTSNVFKKGHTIRVEISSSNFPRFDRNLNTGGNFATETKWVKADQTIHHSVKYPSCIVLPVIPSGSTGAR